jgi:holo-[acyl-carrier protein] synthase
MILGLGLDVCEVARIKRALEAPTGERFRARVFTAGEQAYCEQQRRARFASYAVRFAAKEAAMKALGTGWSQGVGWRDFEVVRRPGSPPTLRLHGRAAALARRRGMLRWLLALSHDGSGAAASVVVEDGVRVTRTAAGVAAPRRGAGGGSARRRPRGRRRSRAPSRGSSGTRCSGR